MSAWLSGLISDILMSLTKRLWERASLEIKEQLAEELVKKHVSKVEAKRKADFIFIDKLIASQGKPLTKEQKDEIRKERARLELELWNTRP